MADYRVLKVEQFAVEPFAGTQRKCDIETWYHAQRWEAPRLWRKGRWITEWEYALLADAEAHIRNAQAGYPRETVLNERGPNAE